MLYNMSEKAKQINGRILKVNLSWTWEKLNSRDVKNFRLCFIFLLSSSEALKVRFEKHKDLILSN